MTSNEIRAAFLKFFESKGHHIVPSAPMVIKNDPTLMFTNAGMNQFKDIFLGNNPAEFPRVADSQKCLRVSGKHNDLEEVGRDTYHHTMFEMLGNWSFGDYFKKEAIAYAWEFLTEVMKLDKNRLYATVFQGDEKDGTDFDQEAYDFWKAYLPEDRILKGNKKDNFWEMGETGPCGPCSEIHIDLRDDADRAQVPGRDLVNKDNPLVIEIWNLVFMQYNRIASGELKLLANKHVDTGMGFERLCMAVQNKKSNYDTDVFQPIIQKIAQNAHVQYGEKNETDIALRVVADHLRAISFAIADGQLPSNTGAGYVIRRILRRAIRYGFTFLNFKEPFMHTLVADLVAQMGHQFPELPKQQTLIERIILEEEQSFLKTLAKGIARFDEYVAKNAGNSVVDGDFAFELFDTYGFPIDLTQLLASEKSLTVDMEGFHQGLQQQKERSRAAAAVATDDWVELVHQETPTQFVGYHETECACKIVKYRKVTAKNKTFYQIVLDTTPFYAESGGQVGDTGVLESVNEKIAIYNTTKENNLTIHHAATIPENPKAEFTAKIDTGKRQMTANNHSATHLLDHALRAVLGTHVEQKGSMVASDRLRFDFSHFAKMTDEEIIKTEKMVNDMIRQNLPLQEFVDMPIEEAREKGAIALFGEKYGNLVRVIQFGDAIELCGGTHTSATGNIGLFKIVSEGAVAAGVRRIEAVTGTAAEELVYGQQDLIKKIKELLGSNNMEQAIQKLNDDNAAYRKKIEEFEKQQVVNFCKEVEQKAQEINGVQVISQITEYSPDILRNAAFQLRNATNRIVVLASVFDNKPNLVVAVSDDLLGRFEAPKIVRAVGKLIQGGGGGQPSLSTAGGKNPAGLPDAVAEIFNLISAN
ncbi:MAG: alanine--tRNA ligase [Bacteroidales bacterium]|nr:alanine--tRNA ligase [Bacteroidales bacterium]